MKTFEFKDSENLGKVVQDSKVFCKLTKNMPMPSYDYIVGSFSDPSLHGLAGHKWSRLCGFTFKSSINAAYPIFQFVYVPKLRGALTRNWHGLHGWYCWQYLANDNRKVVSIDDMMRIYKFSINEFVHSDMFEKYVPIFVSNVRSALAGPVKDLLDSIEDPKMRQELSMYIKAVRISLDEIYEVQKFVHYDNEPDNSREGTYAAGSEPKEGHAKIAYNADKTYGLKNLDRRMQAIGKSNAKQLASKIKASAASSPEKTASQPEKKDRVKFVPSTSPAKSRKPDSEIFDKYDDIADDYE